jgi:ATP-dependent helicase HrpA
LLNEADAGALSWLIPAWRAELITETLRRLPKNIRKNFVPVPEHASRALRELKPLNSFYAAMAQWVNAQGMTVSEEELAALPLPDYLRINVRVISVDGNTLGQGRDLAQLRRAIRARNANASRQVKVQTYRSWEFDAVPEERIVERRGLRFTVYPTLRDLGDSVDLTEAATRAEADEMLRAAVLRLATLVHPEQFKYARKRFNDHRELILLSRGIELARPLPEGLALKCFEQTFIEGVERLPRSAQAFSELLNARRAGFGEIVDRVQAHAIDTLRELRTARQQLASLGGDTFGAIREFVGLQLSMLVPEDFPTGVPRLLWSHLPRFIKAVSRRLERAPGNLKRDAELASQIAPGLRAYRELAAKAHEGVPHPELDRLQWMIEELRVSVFAQDLGTALPVSTKRIADQIEKARLESR